MSEQINLYQPQFRKTRAPLPFATIMGLFGLSAGGIALVTALYAARLHDLEDDFARAKTELQRVVAERDALRSQLAERSTDPQLATQVRKLETVLAHQRRLSRLIEQGTFKAGRGYSDFFLALARQHLEGMWLSDVYISGAGRTLTLRGRTTKPELVPRYIRRLKREPVLAGTEFRQFIMRLPDETSPEPRSANPGIVFELNTVRPDPRL